MKLLVYLILLISSESIFAKSIVLLTSLPTTDTKYEHDIEHRFKKFTWDFYKQGHKIIIKHKADQEILNKTLLDPSTHALFWLSHGAASAPSGSGMQAAAMLLDYNGDNVAKVFQSIHPNVKFVGIMGCNSKLIMQGLLPQRKDLNFYIPTTKVTAKRATKLSTRTFRYFNNRNQNIKLTAPVKAWGYKVQINRVTSGDFDSYKSLQVYQDGKFIGVLPKMQPNSVKDFEIYLPYKKSYSKGDLKLSFSTGQSAFDTSNHFGDIEVLFENQPFWKLFAKPDGTAFGVNVRIFHYKSDTTDLVQPVKYITYKMEKTND